jgi:outer membrane protein, multidrug efflux system
MNKAKYETLRASKTDQRILQGALKAITVALLLTGCASMAPPYETPSLPVASKYISNVEHSGVDPAYLGWREYFNDARLQALISQALIHNRNLRTAVLRVAEVRAVYGITRAERWPTVGSQAGAERSRMPALMNPTSKSMIGNQYNMTLGVTSWEIDFWGRVRSLQDAALESFLATDEMRRAAAISLIAQVALSDLGLRELDERIALARETIANRQESFRIFSRRVAVGSTSRLDLMQVQSLLTQAQTLGAQLEQTRDQQLQALTLLVGATPNLLAVVPALDERHMLKELRPGLPSDLLIQRPDIIAAEHLLKEAHANIGAARAAFFPRVALTNSLGMASAELSGLFDRGSLAWSFSPSISLPLFDGGRRRNNLNLVEVRRELAVANYERTVQTAFRDVADALSARRWLDEQVAFARSALATQMERSRLARLRYDNGTAAFLEVLDAQRDLLGAEQELVQMRRAMLVSRVSLYAALGGGAMNFVSISASETLFDNHVNSLRGAVTP